MSPQPRTFSHAIGWRLQQAHDVPGADRHGRIPTESANGFEIVGFAGDQQAFAGDQHGRHLAVTSPDRREL